MPKVSISVPEQYVRDIALHRGYKDTVLDPASGQDIANTEKEAQFLLRKTKEDLRASVRYYRANKAARDARGPILAQEFNDIT